MLTGALGSLGRAQALRLAQAGAHLVLVDRPELQAAGQALCASLPHTARYIGFDLARTQDIAARFTPCPVDVLINNAALIVNTPLDALTLQEYEAQQTVNATAAFALVQALAPHMKAQGAGKIINLCSVTLQGDWMGYTAYIASKGTLLGLTVAWARELGGYGIHVNAISPGAVLSAAEERVFGDKAQAYADWVLERQCLKRRIQPEHIAELVAFLASPASAMLTGQNIAMDGGW